MIVLERRREILGTLFSFLDQSVDKSVEPPKDGCARGGATNQELARPVRATRMREAEKVEGLWFPLPVETPAVERVHLRRISPEPIFRSVGAETFSISPSLPQSRDVCRRPAQYPGRSDETLSLVFLHRRRPSP